MSLLQGCAAAFSKRYSEAEMNKKIAEGMIRMRQMLQDSSPLCESDAATIQGWSDELCQKVQRGDCIPPGSFWTPGILEFYISLVIPSVKLVYYMQYG